MAFRAPDFKSSRHCGKVSIRWMISEHIHPLNSVPPLYRLFFHFFQSDVKGAAMHVKDNLNLNLV
jgi:hypothetical protein